MTDYAAWIGRTEEATDRVSASALAGLAATLDHVVPPWQPGTAPPLFHWLHFLPHARVSAIGEDGHPRRGGFLPPIDLPRRMWAGSRIEFMTPVAIDSPLRRLSTITDIQAKHGASGALVFVTVRHEVFAGDRIAVREEQDIVYRGMPVAGSPAASSPSPAPAVAAAAQADTVRRLIADPVLLFRFSALTFNSHRIHFDRDYARDVEGYPGLVVHGPLLATLLMDLALRHANGRTPARFAFSAQKPLFDARPIDLCLIEAGEEARLWTRDEAGEPTMKATLEWAAA